MAFEEDIDLQQLFAGEVAERAGRLVEGADALASGSLAEPALRDLVREGHTLKGTARMMGFSAMSDAGKALEDAWRVLETGEIDAGPRLEAALRRLPEELLAAVGADPSTGTPGLAAAIRELRAALATMAPREDRPEPSSSDLDGLLGSIDSRAFGENVRVNAAGLFRLINEVCSLCVDAEALADAVLHMVETGGGSVTKVADLVERTQQGLLDLQGRAVGLAEAPLAEITGTFKQLVRYVARRAAKEVRFELVGDDVSVDRQVLERLADPLRHLVVNAVQHGIEPPDQRKVAGKAPTATVALTARVEDHRLSIVVADDGRGIDWSAVRRVALDRGLLANGSAEDPEALRSVLFSSRFSTTTPSEMGGEGEGLYAVASAVEALHGTVVMESEPGSGTRVTITVPTSRALQDVVLVTAAGHTWGIPAIAVLDRLAFSGSGVRRGGTRMEWGSTSVPVISFAKAVGLRDSEPPQRILVVSTATGPVALLVGSEVGRRQLAARELGPVLGGVAHLTGAALLGGGVVAVIVDPNRLASVTREQVDASGPRRRVLVVDDSLGVRQVVGGALGSAGFEVDLAASPTEALSVLAEQDFDAIVMDYVMPTMDGATLAGRVRDLGITAPIVMLSGAATPDDQRKALAAGANAYLDKDDVRRGALADAIQHLIAAA